MLIYRDSNPHINNIKKIFKVNDFLTCRPLTDLPNWPFCGGIEIKHEPFAANSSHSLLWIKTTTFLKLVRGYWRPETATVQCVLYIANNWWL